MGKNFSVLKAALSPEAQFKVTQETEQMLQEVPLHKLRQARSLSQEMMVKTLHIQQPAVARIEKRTEFIYQPCVAIFRLWEGSWISLQAFQRARSRFRIFRSYNFFNC